jgi:hypothetical protein
MTEKPPSGTRAPGRRLWQSVMGDYELDEHERTPRRPAGAAQTAASRHRTSVAAVLSERGFEACSSPTSPAAVAGRPPATSGSPPARSTRWRPARGDRTYDDRLPAGRSSCIHTIRASDLELATPATLEQKEPRQEQEGDEEIAGPIARGAL